MGTLKNNYHESNEIDLITLSDNIVSVRIGDVASLFKVDKRYVKLGYSDIDGSINNILLFQATLEESIINKWEECERVNN